MNKQYDDKDFEYLRKDMQRIESLLSKIASEMEHLRMSYMTRSEIENKMAKKMDKQDFEVFKQGYDEFTGYFKKATFGVIMAIIMALLALIGIK